jgi:hypothetical protein
MMKRAACGVAIFLAGGAVALGLGAGLKDHHAEKAKGAQAMPEDMQKMMEQWQALSKNGPQHEGLKKFVGKWTTKGKVYMGETVTESAGSTEYELVLGGKFLMQKYNGEMMGQPMQGIGFTGFDNFRKMYVGTWYDSLSTAYYSMSGSMSQDGKTLTMVGHMDEPMTGEIGKAVKWVTREIDNDTHVFEAWEILYGQDFKVFDITYTRAK